jgi:predicted negative regulator of RcsB-dependent stress response
MGGLQDMAGRLTLTVLVNGARRHWRAIAGAALLAVLGSGAWLGYAVHRGARERDAEAAFSRALAEVRKLEAPKDRDEAAVAKFRAVSEGFPGTQAGGEALLRLARRLFDGGKVDEARAAYARYLQDYSAGPLRMMAAIGKAYAEESKGDLAAAEQTLLAAIAWGKDDPLAGEAQVALARIFESQKKTDEAVKVYSQLAEKLPQTRWGQHALERIAFLKGR